MQKQQPVLKGKASSASPRVQHMETNLKWVQKQSNPWRKMRFHSEMTKQE